MADTYEEALKREYKKYLINCGIPSSFVSDDTTLKNYGKTGEFFADLIIDTEKRNDYFKNKKVLILHGGWAEELMYALVRGLLLLQFQGEIIKLEDLTELGNNNIAELLENDVIGIPYFYMDNFVSSPFENYKLYRIQSFILSYIKYTNKILILHSTNPLTDVKWYSSTCLNDLKKYGREIEIDSRD